MVCYVIFWSGQACETDRKVMWVAVNSLLHGCQCLRACLHGVGDPGLVG